MFDILIVDDQTTSLKIMRKLVTKLDYEKRVHCFTDPVAALDWTKQNACDLVIADLRMPVMTGIELTRWFRKLPGCDDIPVVIVTVAEDRQSRYSALQAGATDFLTKPVDHIEFQSRCRNLLSLRDHQRHTLDHARWLEDRVADAVKEIEVREKDTLMHLARAGAYRDPYTGAHVQRMAQYSKIIARSLGLSDELCLRLEFAAPLHDIGKVGVPDNILLKQGPLTGQERQIIEAHTTMGYDILKDSPSKYLQTGAIIALQHHEYFEGGGYPHGLKADKITLEARIVAIADVFDALMTQRPYKLAWTLQDTLAYIKQRSGSQFDPDCVNAFFAALDAILKVRSSMSDNKESYQM